LTPELARRLANLTASDKAELVRVLEELQSRGVANDLDETDMLVLLDEIAKPRPPRPVVVHELMEVLSYGERERLLKPIALQCCCLAEFVVMPVPDVPTDLMSRVLVLRQEKARRFERYGYLPDD
jgi:hypothetical protein